MSLLSFLGFESLSPAPSDDFWYGPVGARTAAGVTVNEDTAMTYAACWAATMALASSEGMLPFKIFRPLGGGGSEVAYEHKSHQLICESPNPEMTAMSFRTSRTNHQINRGNGFAEIERNRMGQAVNLWPIHASRIPKRNIVREQGRLVYYVNNNDGSKTRIDSANMLHVPSPITDDGIYGLGVVTQARLTIGAGIATESHGASYFGNGASPKLIIKGFKSKAKEDKEDFRRQWNEVHGGPENNGKPAILPEGCDVTALNFNAEDSQFLESRTFNIQEICRWYNIQPHMIQELSRSTYSNIAMQSLEFVKFSLMRWLVLWEQEVNRKLLTEEERKAGYFSKHVVEALERADITTRTQALKDQFFNGALTLNQWTALEDRNPIGPVGDMHFVQSAMIPVEVAAKGPQEAQPADGTPSTSPLEDLNAKMNAYGIGVRAGALTPQTDDENAFREEIGLPSMSADAQAAWKDDEGIRRPITLRDPNAPASPFGQPAKPADEPADEPALSTTVQIDIEGLRTELTSKIETLSTEKAELLQLATSSQQQAASAIAISKQVASAMLRDVMSRMVSLEVNAVKRVAEKASKFDSRLREFYGKHTATLERELLQPVTVCLLAGGDGRQASEVVKGIAAEHTTESLKQLDALLDCQAEELPGKVEACVSKWHEERATVTL